jgi:lipoprotein-anchoring transpeptidase ErfK/SrfK
MAAGSGEILEMLKIVGIAVALFAAVAAGVAPAKAEIVAQVNIASQTMTVTVDGISTYTWPVSTARRGYVTPKGSWGVQSMHKMTYSSLFNNAPMPWTIFYSGHYGIHGTTDVKKLGQPASAGCVRLHPDNARVLFEMVKERGPKSFKVVVEG